MLTKAFAYTGATQVWTVPVGVTSVFVTLKGASGGGYLGSGGSGDAGTGGLVSGWLAVTPGENLRINVGGHGASPPGNPNATGQDGGAGGWNGGGRGGTCTGNLAWGGYGGGGATDIRQSGNTLADRKGVAAGGGGRGVLTGTQVLNGAHYGGGGDGGAATGEDGGVASGVAGFLNTGTGGSGGTSSAGGTKGFSGGAAGQTATDGASGQGGHGSDHPTAFYLAGSGGGGGYYGGGGGGGTSDDSSGSGGGGGGSNYVGGLTTTTSTRGAGVAGGHGTATIQYNAAPNQPALSSPANNVRIAEDKVIRVAWTFSDSDPADSQSAADVRWRVGAGAWTTITSASPDADAYYDFAANTFAAYTDQSVEWQVRTYDSFSVVGPWSASRYFIPTPTPTAPTFIGTPVVHSNVVWVAFNTPDGALQSQARTLTDVAGSAGAVVSTSAVWGDGASTPTTVAVGIPSYAYINGADYHIQVRYAYRSGIWTDWVDSGPLTANINSPLAPTIDVYPLDDTASVRIEIANPSGDPFPPTHNDVYRTPMFGTGDEQRIATNVALNGTYTDWRAGLHRPYRYRVEAVTATGAFTSSD